MIVVGWCTFIQAQKDTIRASVELEGEKRRHDEQLSTTRMSSLEHDRREKAYAQATSNVLLLSFLFPADRFYLLYFLLDTERKREWV